jgi:hypothetical protein
MTKRRQVAIEIPDPDNPNRYVHVRGSVVEITEAGAEEHLHRLARRYLNRDRYPDGWRFPRRGEAHLPDRAQAREHLGSVRVTPMSGVVSLADGLPAPGLRPEQVFTLPELQYPARLNVARELLDANADGGRAGRPAIVAGERTITYAELQKQVNRLVWRPGGDARRLRRRGHRKARVRARAVRHARRHGGLPCSGASRGDRRREGVPDRDPPAFECAARAALRKRRLGD